jgi:hypothetical protein
MSMSPQPIATRVERLEQRMAALEGLPARVEAIESQIVQLRVELNSDFSALRMEMRAGDEETRRALREDIGKRCDALSGQFRGEIGQLRGEISAMGDRLEAAIQEARDHSRALFEEVIERIARIAEGARRRPRRKP